MYQRFKMQYMFWNCIHLFETYVESDKSIAMDELV
jgi:hypothetical protein